MKKVISSWVCAEGFTPVMVDSKKSTVKDYGQSLRRVNVNDIHNPYLQILQGSGKSEKKILLELSSVPLCLKKKIRSMFLTYPPYTALMSMTFLTRDQSTPK